MKNQHSRVPVSFPYALLALTLLVIAFGAAHSGSLERLDRLLYDSYQQIFFREPAKDIVIVPIDEKSLDIIGRWPWSRSKHAALIERLTQANVKAIGYDVLFPDTNINDPKGDLAFARAMESNGKVILPVLHEKRPSNRHMSIIQPLEMLSNAARKLAHIDSELDPDGLVRSVYLRAGLGNTEIPSFGLAVTELGLGHSIDLPGVRNSQQTHTLSKNHWIRDYQILIPFAGSPGHFDTVSFADVLTDDQVLGKLHDKYVLVGVTAQGYGGHLPTPISKQSRAMPAVEFHANVVDTLLRKIAIEPLSSPWNILFTLCLVLAPLALYPKLRPRWALVSMLCMMITTFALSAIFLRYFHRWFAPTPALLAIILSFPLWSWLKLESIVRQLFLAKERAEVTVRSIADGVITTDNQGNIEYMNPVAESLTGFRLDEAHGSSLDKIFKPIDEFSGRSQTKQFISGFSDQQIDLPDRSTLIDRYGNEHAIRSVTGVIRDRDGKADGMVLAISDVSETQKIHDHMVHQASHDELTQLPNRTLLMDRLHQAIPLARRNNKKIAVLFIDLDNFKNINDGLGHSSGDLLIKAVADRLKKNGREGDTIARLGGDEFVIILENIAFSEDVASIAGKILKTLSPPFWIGSQEAFISSSIGVSLYPKDGLNAETLMKNADTAMYRAKEHGKDNFQFFSKEMNSRITKRLEMEKHLRYALDKNELEVHYQPQIQLKSGQIVGVEALLRWHHEELGDIPPSQFIALAEDTGLIFPLGEWVIQTACQQASAWQQAGLFPIQMAVNLSPRQFYNQNILQLLKQILTDTHLSPEFLKIEITEGLLMKDFDRTAASLRQFRDLGGKVSIDDFGTGYSSLSYLKHIPVDQLKIDRSFIWDLSNNANDAAITRAIITMAHGMRLDVVAEGVENKEQLDILTEQQCDEVQGYYFSVPLPASKMTELLLNNQETKHANITNKGLYLKH